MMAWAHSVGGGGEVHAFRMRALRKHPAWGWKNPETGVKETIDQVHEQDDARKVIAIPAAYDVGAQRNSWVSQGITNWMGDDGFLNHSIANTAASMSMAISSSLKPRSLKNTSRTASTLSTLIAWAENQRGEVTAPRQSHRHLPSKPINKI